MSQKNQIRIKRIFSLIAHSPNVVELRYGVWNPVSFTLTDESESGHLYNLLRALDGSASAAELARRERVPLADVEALIDHLVQLGAAEVGTSSALDHYLDQIVPTLRPATDEPLTSRPVLLLGDAALTREIGRNLQGDILYTDITILPHDDPAWKVLAANDTSWLMDGLAFEETVKRFEPWQDNFLVLASRVVNPVQYRLLNRVCLRYRIPWLHAAMDGPFLLVGPLFVPYRSACYECFETRVAMNLRATESYVRYKEALVNGQVRQADMPVEPVLLNMLAAHTALEILNFLVTNTSFTVNKVLAIYLPTMEFSYNELLRVPGCPGCSPSAGRDDKELYFDMRSLIRHTSLSLSGA